MNVHKAHWLIENTTDDNTNDKINVTYQFVIDPKSRFPMWLANKYLLKSTLNTLQNINAKFSGVLDKPH
ncbi:hypothetical protein [Thalassotalea piscium]|uniref:START domain-containing protein n=1 Tax=Thalassotalea piscium TaxID=1230533 RepID=A0A7X0NF61_9GAMM|nr:hypothetical protein [Thalassotalea piscium]MBB6542213.1 hypothetical protein [Thalassotalea piscium]